MAKETLKDEVIEAKGNHCELTGGVLPDEKSLFDTHRGTPKRKNGIYTIENTGVVLPIPHMVEHGTYRGRDPELDALKTRMDDRAQIMKLLNKINNQIRAYQRGTDNPNPDTVEFLTELRATVGDKLKELSAIVEKHVLKLENPLAGAALKLKGVGPISIAACLTYIDLSKARHASSLWSYTGLHKASHERYTKGEAGGGNKTLRTILYTMAESQVKCHGAYRYVYDQVKERLSISEKVVKTRNTQGKLVEAMWKDTKPSHRHGAALRAVMKHFLADYWFVGRTLAGLPTSALYPEAILGGTHRTIMPEERGWIY